jgi:hypothetical protein
MFIPPARFTDRISNSGNPSDKRHGQLNFELCTALNMTSLKIALEKLVNEAGLSPQLAQAYEAQAMGLLNVMLSENNRLHGF